MEVDQQIPRAVTVAPPSEAIFAPNNAVLEVTLEEVGVLIVGASGQAEVVPVTIFEFADEPEVFTPRTIYA